MLLVGVLLLLALLVLLMAVISYFVSWSKLPWYSIIVIVVSWWFPFSIPVVLPLDLASTHYDAYCNHTLLDGLLRWSIPIQNATDNALCAHQPLAYVDPLSLRVYWKTLYWTMFCLTWLIIPTMITWIRRGETRLIQRLWRAFLENLLFNLVLFSVGVMLALYALLFKNFTWVNLTETGMAAANAWGLLLITFMMGYGLVEIPRGLWYKSDPEWKYGHTLFQIPEYRDSYTAAKEKFFNCAAEIVITAQNTSTSEPIYKTLDFVAHQANFDLADPHSISSYYEKIKRRFTQASQLPPVNHVELLRDLLRKGPNDYPEIPGLVPNIDRPRSVAGNESPARGGVRPLWEIGSPPVAVEADEKYVWHLNARIKRLKLRYLRAKSVYDRYRNRASFCKDIVDNQKFGWANASLEEAEPLIGEQQDVNQRAKYGKMFISVHTTKRLSGVPLSEIEFTPLEKIRLRIYWWWYCVFRKYLLRFISIFLGVISVIVLWSESIFQIEHPILSIPALILRKTTEIGFGSLEIFSSIFLGYMCLCTFMSLFKVKFLDYKLVGDHCTDANSIMWIGGYLCKVTFPLCYNFLRLVQDETSVFTVYQGRAASLTPILGERYSNWLPLTILLFSTITFFNFHGKLLRKIEIQTYFHEVIEDTSANFDLVEDGRMETESWRKRVGYAITY